MYRVSTVHDAQAFTDAAMRQYMPSVLDVANRTLEQWAASSAPVTFYSAARCFAFDVAATVLTGARFDGGQLGKESHTTLRYLKYLTQATPVSNTGCA